MSLKLVKYWCRAGALEAQPTTEPGPGASPVFPVCQIDMARRKVFHSQR